MASIRKEIPLDAGAEDVWDAVRDIGALHTRLVPGFVTDTKLEPGARIVTFANGMIVRELIVDLDDKARRLAWSAVGGRLTHHNASAQVFAEGDKSRLVWTADLLPHQLAGDIRLMIDHGAAALQKAFAKRCRSGASHGPLEAVFARLVEVARQDALARLPKAHPHVESVRLVEARVGPEDHARDALLAAPVERCLDQRAPGAATAQTRVEIEAMKLGAAVVQALDAHRADDHAALAHHVEGAARRCVVPIELEQIGDLDLGHVDEAVFEIDAADQLDHAGHIGAPGRP